MLVKRLVLRKAKRVVLLAFTGMIIISCSNKNGGSKVYTKLVKTAKAEKISAEKIKHYPAIVEEAEEVNLAFRVAGPIQRIYVKEGDYVKKGQLIAQMDTRDYEVQKRAIEAQVNQLQSEYKRIEELKNRESVAINDYEKMKAGKEIAEAKLKNAKDQLRDTKLYAPFSGYITKVMFDDGALVNHGTPIATMIDVSQLKVEINVPPSVYINKEYITKIECTQDNFPGESFPLTLYSNNIKANNNGLYKFYLYYNPKSKKKLSPGMNVMVHVTCSQPGSELMSIPVTALFEKDKNSYVWVVKENKVEPIEVSTNNLVFDGNIGIVSGLKEGEEVVVGGLNLLTEGETVRIIPPASESNVGNIL